MRMDLFRFEAMMHRSIVEGFIVAPAIERAHQFLASHFDDDEIVVEDVRAAERDLPGDMRLGLEDLLCGAPVGLASYHAQVGWIAHAAPVERLCLFRIEDDKGDDTFVIAPTEDFAAAIYCSSFDLGDEEHLLFRMWDGMEGLAAEKEANLTALLEVGPVGIATFDSERGWSIAL